MKKHLLYSPDGADSGASSVQQIDGGGSSPSGTLVIGDSGSDEGDGGDSDSEKSSSEPEIVASPVKEKIPIGNKTIRPGKDVPKFTDKELEEEVDASDTMEDEITRLTEDERKKQEEEKASKVKAGEAKGKGGDNQANTGARDYSIFSPEETEVAKKVPNHVFDLLKSTKQAFIAEQDKYKKLEAQFNDASKGVVKLPESYVEHPEAWIHNPKVPELRARLGQTKSLARHFETQLINIENGGNWHDVTGVDANGNFTYQEISARETTAKDKLDIQRRIMELAQDERMYEGEIGQLRSSHKQQHEAMVGNITKHLDSFCPWRKDQKVMDTLIPVADDKGNITQKSVKAVGEETLRTLGPLSKNILAPAIVELARALAIEQAKLISISAKQIKEQQVKDDSRAAEPVIGRGAGKTPKPAATVPDVSDMDE